MLTLKICVGVFSGIFKARMLKLFIHIDNELYSSLYMSIFLSSRAKFVSQFSQELYKLESSNMVYICRLSDCIVDCLPSILSLLAVYRAPPTVLVYTETYLKCVVSFSVNKYCSFLVILLCR